MFLLVLNPPCFNAGAAHRVPPQGTRMIRDLLQKHPIVGCNEVRPCFFDQLDTQLQAAVECHGSAAGNIRFWRLPRLSPRNHGQGS